MKVELDITMLLGSISVLFSAAVGLLVWRLQRAIERREKARTAHMALIVKGIDAAITLGEACAIAQRDGKPNGATQKALDYAQEVHHEQKDFLAKQVAQKLF